MTTTWPVIGHLWAVQQLQHAIEHDEVPHALLITGPESIGKMTLALTLVAALMCQSEDARPCGQCLACRKLKSGNHPDFMQVSPEDKTSHLKIDQIREVERFLALTPNESSRKIALISDFERATTGAANALLKTLEEPPKYAHLILIATDADLLLPTIVSRTQEMNLRPLSAKEVAHALVTQWNVDEALADRLARLSGGRIGWAVKAATEPAYYEKMTSALEVLGAVLQQDLPTRFETAQTLADNAAELSDILEHWLVFWRDVLLLQTRNGAAVVHTERHGDLTRLAEGLSVQETLAVLGALERSANALLSNANTLLLVENLLLDLPTLQPQG